MEYTDMELVETLKVASGDAVGSSEAIDTRAGLKYKEAQYHGEIAFAQHVECIILPKEKYAKMETQVQRICGKHGWDYRWMEDEKTNRESMGTDFTSPEKVQEWKKKLSDLMHAPAAAEVKAGTCVKGCGRPVAPGVYQRTGQPFRTCCRGCALGFGHDLRCGVRPDERGPCEKGCGFLAAPGKQRNGRPFKTCCRSCAKGIGHDPDCTRDPALFEIV
jgi:hypothetical protein